MDNPQFPLFPGDDQEQADHVAQELAQSGRVAPVRLNEDDVDPVLESEDGFGFA